MRFFYDSTLTVEGIGKVEIKGKDGKETVIEEVLLDMKNNLLSLGQLLEKGFMMNTENSCLKVFDKEKRLIIKANLSQNRTFKIGVCVMKHECLATSVSKIERLWHKRFGHLNFKDLHLLTKKNIVQGLPQVNIPSEVCDKCLECKQTEGTFNRFVPTRAIEKLGIIHSYVCGPMQVETPSGNRYFISFIDDLTRKVWIYEEK